MEKVASEAHSMECGYDQDFECAANPDNILRLVKIARLAQEYLDTNGHPGAFTGTCMTAHRPTGCDCGYEALREALK
jgi:hypothetical protein